MDTFDAATRRRIRTAISDRAPHARCPMCESASWSLEDGFVTLGLERVPGSLAYPETGLPSVALVCTQCGYTVLFNAVALGLGDLLPRTTMAS